MTALRTFRGLYHRSYPAQQQTEQLPSMINMNTQPIPLSVIEQLSPGLLCQEQNVVITVSGC